MQEPVLNLLESPARSSEISSLQVYKGFQRLADQLDDFSLETSSPEPAMDTPMTCQAESNYNHDR
jgi:hypothetical protein